MPDLSAKVRPSPHGLPACRDEHADVWKRYRVCAVLAEQFDAFLLDLDGVVYIGAELLPGAAEALGRLRGAGKTIRFLTNDPRPTRRELAEKLTGLGIEARVGEIITCG